MQVVVDVGAAYLNECVGIVRSLEHDVMLEDVAKQVVTHHPVDLFPVSCHQIVLVERAVDLVHLIWVELVDHVAQGLHVLHILSRLKDVLDALVNDLDIVVLELEFKFLREYLQ